ELLPFEDGELVDITGLHLPEGVPDGLVGPDRQEVGRHEVGNPEVLDLVPLHGGPAAGKASIAAERIRKFFRSPRPDNEDEVDSARSEARRDSADPPEPFLDPRHFERRCPGVSRRNAWACSRSTTEGRFALPFPPDGLPGYFRSCKTRFSRPGGSRRSVTTNRERMAPSC